MGRDYYAVLGVSVGATPGQIRRAYRELARRYSPDVNLWDRDAHRVFEEIEQAYRVLIDPTARSVYDRHGVPGERRQDVAEAAGAPRVGDDLHVPIVLSFRQAVSGATLELTVDRQSACQACRATGLRPGARPVPCTYCGATGAIWIGHGIPRASPCPACEGHGERRAEACLTCRGRGVRPERSAVQVTIPPGMDTGAELRVPGEGHAGPFGGPRGDLIVITNVEADPDFVRKGDNLHREFSITVPEAVLGARVTIPTLDREVSLTIPPGTQSGQVFRLRGKGMPRLSAAGRGDLYVTVRVDIPRGIDARTQELFRELDRLLPDHPRSTREPSRA